MAVTEQEIARINELAKKAKRDGLTPEETVERDGLRKKFIEAFRSNLRSELDTIVIRKEDGSETRVKDLRKKKD